jgi:hypothetical protein
VKFTYCLRFEAGTPMMRGGEAESSERTNLKLRLRFPEIECRGS